MRGVATGGEKKGVRRGGAGRGRAGLQLRTAPTVAGVRGATWRPPRRWSVAGASPAVTGEGGKGRGGRDEEGRSEEGMLEGCVKRMRKRRRNRGRE